MVLCLLLQLALTQGSIDYYNRSGLHVIDLKFGQRLLFLGVVMLLQVFGILMQAAIWAVLFTWFLGEFEAFSVAFYHSVVNFASLGYGDMVMSPRHRLLGALESVNGVLMIGLSTAMMMAAVQLVMRQDSENDLGAAGKKIS